MSQATAFANLLYNDGTTILPSIGTDSDGFAITLTTAQNQLAYYSVSTSSTALPLGPLTTAALAWLLAINLDTTNYITLYHATSGQRIARLQPGAPFLAQLGEDCAAPFVKANTAACLLQYVLLGP